MAKNFKALVVGAGALAVLALCLSGCGSKSTASPTTTIPTTASTTIPANITPQYLNGVMATLNHVEGDVRREVYSTQSFPDDAKQKLADIYESNIVNTEEVQFSNESEVTHPEAKSPPGDEVDTVVDIVAASYKCIEFHANADNKAVLVSPSATPTETIILYPEPGNNGDNTTTWKIGLRVVVSLNRPVC